MEELHPAETAIPQSEAPAEERTEGSERKKIGFKDIFFAHFTAARIAYMAVFTALAYVVTFLEFPIFPPPANFLQLDFANVFFMIEGFIFGPVEAVVSILIKELLCLADSKTMGVGEVANFIMSFAYIVLPAVCYRFKKGKGWVVLYLALACVVQTGASLLVNRYINFPFFGALGAFGSATAAETFASLWQFVLYFNLIKSVSIGVVVFLLYKPLSRFIQITAAKFDKRLSQSRKKRREERERKKSSAKKTENSDEA